MVSVFINTCCTKHWIGKCPRDMISNSLWQQGPRVPEKISIGRKANSRGIIWNVSFVGRLVGIFVHFSLGVDLWSHVPGDKVSSQYYHNPEVDPMCTLKTLLTWSEHIELPSTDVPGGKVSFQYLLSTTILSLMPSVLVLFERKRKLDPNILSCRRLLMVVLFQSKNKSEHIELPFIAGPCSSAAYSTSILTRCTETKLKQHQVIITFICMFGTVNENSMLNIKTYVWISKWKLHDEFQNICLDRWMIIKTLTYEKDKAG